MLAPHDPAVLTHLSSTSPCLVGSRAPRSCMVVMPTAARCTPHAAGARSIDKCGCHYTHKLSDIGAGRARVLGAAALARELRGMGRARVHRVARPWWGTVLARDRASCVMLAELWWAVTGMCPTRPGAHFPLIGPAPVLQSATDTAHRTHSSMRGHGRMYGATGREIAGDTIS